MKLPTRTGAVITFRGNHGLQWLAFLTGNGMWNVIRQDTWESYAPRQETPESLLDEIGSALRVIDKGI